VRCADVGSAVNTPARIVPDVGQRTDDDCKASPTVDGKKSADVLDERERRRGFCDDPDEFAEKSAACAGADASALPCDADVLTWEASDDDVNNAAKSNCRETDDVSSKEHLPVLFEHGAAMLVPFDATNRLPPQQAPSLDAPAAAREEV
jgi:hypothetical protein